MQFSAILTSFVLAGILSAPSFAYAKASATVYSNADTAVLDMAQAYKQRDRKQLGKLLPQTRGSILEAWAAYFDLSARLDEASSTEIANFFAKYAGTYQEDKLRVEYLLQLGRQRDWTGFNREYPKYRMGDDRSVRCYALLADHLSSGADVNTQVKEIWLSLRDTDEGCAAAADQIIKDHSDMAHLVWLRARLGMESDKLHIATQAVRLLNDKWAKTVNSIYLNPGKYLNDKVTALRPQTREFVSLALIRQAYLDPTEAAVEVEKLRWKAQLTQEERSWIWGVIGKRAAQKQSPDALDFFAHANAAHLHDDHLLWLARAALRAGRWDKVLTTIDAMPIALQKDATWVYWRARALLQMSATESNRAQATTLFESIAGQRGFYEQLAREELGQRLVLPPRPPALSPEEKESARLHPGLNRALYAMQIGLRAEGVREWNYYTNLHTRGGMDDRSLLAAADLACRLEVWDRCINTSDRTKTMVDMEQRYPMPFKAEVIARAQFLGIDPAFVYGLIRQESRFITDAKSSVGASGLMQVMPATARWTAKKIGLTDFRGPNITDRDTNIAIGTGYLKLLLDNFGGSLPMAAAAYNAGPGRPRTWRSQNGAAVLDAAIWAENIPFNETRDYVKKVLANTTNYATLITGQPQSLKVRLGKVGPRDASLPEQGLDLP